jgi:hypothetical protein
MALIFRPLPRGAGQSECVAAGVVPGGAPSPGLRPTSPCGRCREDTSAARRTVGDWCTGLAIAALLAVTSAAARAAPVDQPVRATFQQLPLRTLLGRLQAATGVPLILDRRLDPTRRISLECRGERLDAILGRLADETGTEVAVLKGSAWLVPTGEAGRITAADELLQGRLRQLPPTVRRRLERAAPWSWPAGATPAGLLEELREEAAAGGLPLPAAGLTEAIPHDHLAAGSLLPLMLAERFDLIAMQYGLRVDWQMAGMNRARLEGRLVPVPAEDAGRTARPTTSTSASARPRQPVTPGRRPADGATSRYTLRVAAPFTELLAAVAKQLDLEPRIDRATLRRRGVDSREIVRLKVADVDRDGLLDAIVEPLGLTWTIEGRTLTVTAAPRVTP